MNNNLIIDSIDKILSGKPSTITLDLTLEESLVEILKLLMEKEFEFTITYFSSRGNELFDVEDHIRHNSNSGSLKVDHQPMNSKGEYLPEVFNATPEQYTARLKFPEAITFVEMEYTSPKESEALPGTVTFNRYQKVLSPMEKVDLGYGSYVSIARTSKHLMIACQPKE